MDAINKRSTDDIADAIGDIMVTLIIHAKMWKLDVNACIEQAYQTIAPRRGKMVAGVFVRE